MRRMKQVLAVVAAITMAAAPAVVVSSAAAAGPAVANGAVGSQWTVKNPFKAGFIYVGAPSDAGWTHAHDVGRLEVQKYFGGRVETMYKEDVPEGPQCAQVITQLVDAGRQHHIRHLLRLPARARRGRGQVPGRAFRAGDRHDGGQDLV